MNFTLDQIPSRASKPRQHGLTMVMDKGLGVRQAEDLVEASSPFIDIIKLGFGSSMITPNLEKKLDVYRSANIPVYLGGTLLEAYIIRNRFEDYLRLIDKYKLTHAEVSDGSISLPHEEKLEYIRQLSKRATVLTEVGSKEEGIIIHPNKWIELINLEIQAGAWKVIAEAREAGNVGIYRGSGEVREGLVQEILTQIPQEKILWEAPQKAQQLYFLQLIGCNVNLGNIAPSEIIALEAMRIGLRGDTFEMFLDKK